MSMQNIREILPLCTFFWTQKGSPQAIFYGSSVHIYAICTHSLSHIHALVVTGHQFMYGILKASCHLNGKPDYGKIVRP